MNTRICHQLSPASGKQIDRSPKARCLEIVTYLLFFHNEHIIIRKSRSFRACIWQHRTKAFMTKVTSRLEYTKVLHYYFLYFTPRYYMHKCTTPILHQFMYHNQCITNVHVWWCNVLLPRVSNRVTGTCSQTINLNRCWIFVYCRSVTQCKKWVIHALIVIHELM
jgi:hypothetical protein